jgi:hypothetical protein
MKYALNVVKDNRIHSALVVLPNGHYDGMPIMKELPEGNLPDYLFVDGEYVYNPLPKPEPVEPTEERTVWDELDAAYQEGVDSV